MLIQNSHPKTLATIYLAKNFLTLKVGNKLKTISEYCEDSGYARGTIQNALNLIKSSGAIETVSRGHLGTIIKNIDYYKLWTLTGHSMLTGAMPLPYSLRYEGLATGLYKSIQEHKTNIDMKIAYVNGAKSRIKLLIKNKYDFVVTSKLAGIIARKEGLPVKDCFDFGPSSYVSKHVLILADNNKTEIENGMIIGVDETSTDMLFLTELLCKEKQVILKNIPYNQIVEKIINKEIDASIWNYDEIVEQQYDLNVKEIDNENIPLLSHAVILINKEDLGTEHFLKNLFYVDFILNTQQQVVNKEIIPQY